MMFFIYIYLYLVSPRGQLVDISLADCEALIRQYEPTEAGTTKVCRGSHHSIEDVEKVAHKQFSCCWAAMGLRLCCRALLR